MKRLLLILFMCSVSYGNWGTLEDFTTYTEVDPGNDIAKIANTITWTNFETRNTDSYVYKDMTAAHFSADFAHRVKVEATAMNNDAALGTIWMIANIVDEVNGIINASDDFIYIYFYRAAGPVYTIRMNLFENGGLISDVSVPFALSTTYYLTIERDDDGGANNTGQYTLRVYTTNYYGEGGAVHVGTVTSDCSVGEQNDFRYIYATCSRNSAFANKLVSGTVQDLDLGEAAVAGASQVIMTE